VDVLYSSHTLEHVSHYHDDARERYYFGDDSPELANHETKTMTNSDVGMDGVPGDVNNSVGDQEASVPEESTSTVLRRWRQVPRSPASLPPSSSLSSPGSLSLSQPLLPPVSHHIIYMSPFTRCWCPEACSS